MQLRNFYNYIRLIFGTLILIYIFTLIDVDSLNINIINIFLFISIFLMFFDRFINAYRWYKIISIKKLNIKLIDIMKIYFKSCFVGTIIPSNIGGEILKGYILSRKTSEKVHSFSSVIIERVFGIFALTSICFTFSFIFDNYIDNSFPFIFVKNISMIISFLIFFIVILIFYFPFIKKILTFYSYKKGLIFQKIKNVYESFYDYKNYKYILFFSMFCSFLIQFVRIFCVWSIGKSIGLEFEILYYIIFVPFISLLSMLPFSPSGIGLQEGAFVYFFSLIGGGSSEIAMMAILVRMLTIVSSVPGFFIYLKDDVFLYKEAL